MSKKKKNPLADADVTIIAPFLKVTFLVRYVPYGEHFAKTNVSVNGNPLYAKVPVGVTTVTECMIDYCSTAGFGRAKLHSDDQPNRQVGKFYALVKALETFNKEIRSKIIVELFQSNKFKGSRMLKMMTPDYLDTNTTAEDRELCVMD